LNPTKLGILTYLAIPIFALTYYLGDPEAHFSILRMLSVSTLMLAYLSLVAYYVFLVYTNQEFKTAKKNKWFLALFLFHIIAMPIYWHRHVRLNKQRA